MATISEKPRYRVFYLGYDGKWYLEAAFVELSDAKSWVLWQTGQQALEDQVRYCIRLWNKVIFISEEYSQ